MPQPASRALRASSAPDVAVTFAYDRLLQLVVRGELAPGAKVTEPMVADRLGISRTPVREAMQRLALEGLLVPAGGGERPRLAVAPLDPEEARDLYETTGLLEGAGARAAATWSATRRATLAAALRADDTAFRTAARAPNPDPAALFARHHAFHQRIARETASPVAQALLRSLEPRLVRYEWYHGPLLQLAGVPFEPTYDEHTAIIAAVRRGTARDIEHAIRTNWTNAAARLTHAITRARAVVGAA